MTYELRRQPNNSFDASGTSDFVSDNLTFVRRRVNSKVGLLRLGSERDLECKRMKLTLHSFKSNLPREKVCQPGVEYEVFDTEVGPNQAFTFLDRLVFPRDSFYLEASLDYLVDFWKHEQSLWVEVTGSDFWATSEVSLDEAKAIIDSLDRGERFGNQIPTTKREWDAYTPASEK